MKKENYISIKGKAYKLDTPKIMGILNVTPDSFYDKSRAQTKNQIYKSVSVMLEEGVDIVDVGAYSSRPGAQDITMDDELRRVRFALQLLRTEFPELIISLDTFRHEVARIGIEDFGVDIINDISGGGPDMLMYDLVAEKSVAYILMHMQGKPKDMQHRPVYSNVIDDITEWFNSRLVELKQREVTDIIIDPGFGFGKTVDQNYQMLNNLERFKDIGFPVLAGLSRKSMIWKRLDITPEESLNATTALNMIALNNGASILRVHDVKDAVETVKLHLSLRS